ncbi:MAG: hypothetical protein LAT57_05010 [Balneolales bacterium]|nr:hypothetical protein [Balneolales bacterium]
MLRLRFTIFTLLLVMISSPAICQSVRSFAFPDSLAIGDNFTFVITSQYPPGRYQPVYPDETAFDDAFEFISVQRYRGVQSRDSIVYRLQFFALQDTLMPELPVNFIGSEADQSVLTPPVPLYFKSLLDPVSDDLRPLKPIFEFARSYVPFILGGLLLIIIAAILWLYRDRFKQREPEVLPEPVPVPPFVNPLKRLSDEINELQAVNYDDYKELYSRLSIAFREYFEDVYDILALESTTKEVLRDLSVQGLDDLLHKKLAKLLRDSDMAKFARYKPTTDQVADILVLANEMLQSLKKFDAHRLSSMKYDYEVRHGIREIEPVDRPLITPKKENL